MHQFNDLHFANAHSPKRHKYSYLVLRTYLPIYIRTIENIRYSFVSVGRLVGGSVKAQFSTFYTTEDFVLLEYLALFEEAALRDCIASCLTC